MPMFVVFCSFQTLEFSCSSNFLYLLVYEQNVRVFDKRDVTLPEIREIGEYIAEIKLHPEVTATVRLNVIPN